MSHRKAIDSELVKFELLANRLENNLKNVTQTLVNDRNHYKAQYEAKDKEANDLNTENVKLKAINGCLDHQQKLYEQYTFKNHDQSFMSKFVEAATKYAGDQGCEAGSANQTPRPRDSLPSSSFNAPTAANNDVFDVDDVVEVDQ